MKKLSVLCACLLGFATLASAQIVTNPTKVEFTKSADHDVMLDTYTPAVMEYVMMVYAPGADQPTVTFPLGKPTPDEAGIIQVSFDQQMITWPISTTVTYYAKVAANGPYGSGVSGPSNEFNFNNQYKCSFTVSPTSWTVLPGGGTSTLRITPSASGCQWVLTLPPWARSSLTGGTATTTVTLTADPNTTDAARTASLSVGSMRPATFTLSQAPLPPNATPPTAPSGVRLFQP